MNAGQGRGVASVDDPGAATGGFSAADVLPSGSTPPVSSQDQFDGASLSNDGDGGDVGRDAAVADSILAQGTYGAGYSETPEQPMPPPVNDAG
jgi:hypothetical protein